jgi:ribonuclease HI
VTVSHTAHTIRTAELALRQPGLPDPDGVAVGQIRMPEPDELRIYTDGSVSKQKFAKGQGFRTGWGYLATDGRYGCGRYPQFVPKVGKDPATVTELRAVLNAIADLLPTTRLTVVTDSQAAMLILAAWQNGSTDMPRGYVGATKPGKVPALEQLRHLVVTHAANLTVEKVKGHAGDVLNEGADTLAQLGMRWMRDNVADDEVARRAAGIAEGFLADWRRR